MLPSPSLNRPNTVSFSVPAITSSRSSYNAVGTLVTARYGREAVSCFQARGASTFLMSFASQARALRAVEEGFPYEHQLLPITEVTSGVTRITVTDAPFELPHERVVKALSFYGTVKRVSHVRADPAVGAFFTGDRLVTLEMKKRVPNILNIDGFEVMCWYRDVARLCRRCGTEGHNASDCPTPAHRPVRCENCGNRWHLAADCPGCSFCRTEAHTLSACPHRLAPNAAFSAVFLDTADQVTPPVVLSDPPPSGSPPPSAVPPPPPSSSPPPEAAPAPKRLKTGLSQAEMESETGLINSLFFDVRTPVSDTPVASALSPATLPASLPPPRSAPPSRSSAPLPPSPSATPDIELIEVKTEPAELASASDSASQASCTDSPLSSPTKSVRTDSSVDTPEKTEKMMISKPTTPKHVFHMAQAFVNDSISTRSWDVPLVPPLSVALEKAFRKDGFGLPEAHHLLTLPPADRKREYKRILHARKNGMIFQEESGDSG